MTAPAPAPLSANPLTKERLDALSEAAGNLPLKEALTCFRLISAYNPAQQSAPSGDDRGLREAAKELLETLEQEAVTFFRCEACGHQHDEFLKEIDLWMLTEDARVALRAALSTARDAQTQPCFECGGTEMLGPICAACNPEISAPPARQAQDGLRKALSRITDMNPRHTQHELSVAWNRAKAISRAALGRFVPDIDSESQAAGRDASEESRRRWPNIEQNSAIRRDAFLQGYWWTLSMLDHTPPTRQAQDELREYLARRFRTAAGMLPPEWERTTDAARNSWREWADFFLAGEQVQILLDVLNTPPSAVADQAQGGE